MPELFTASRQWVTRPDDERFTSLIEMASQLQKLKASSRQTVVSSRRIEVTPHGAEGQELAIMGASGVPYQPTNWAFGQLASLVEAPAAYLRKLPAAMAADCLNFGLKFTRDAKDTGILLRRGSEDAPGQFCAATGPNYGRIWNSDICQTLVDKFGNGVDGDWRVPGEFGRQLPEVTKANTTLYASDRDMFVFLADEDHKITMHNRRGGEPGLLSRGFFVWNSEVGSQTFGMATFLFDYACKNRIVWGAQDYREIRIRHTASGPDKFIEQAMPQIQAMSRASAKPVEDMIAAAQRARVESLDDFLAKRFASKAFVAQLHAVHETEEARPIETLWDVSTAITAVAREYQHQDSRVALERQAGAILDLVKPASSPALLGL